MKKENCYKVCYLVSILILVGLPIKLVKDYMAYTTTLNSAPFYLWAIVDCMRFLLPAAILFLVGKFLKEKFE